MVPLEYVNLCGEPLTASHERDGFHTRAVTAWRLALASAGVRDAPLEDDELELALMCPPPALLGFAVGRALNREETNLLATCQRSLHGTGDPQTRPALRVVRIPPAAKHM